MSQKPEQTNFTIDFKFATNSCRISDEKKEELKKKFFDAFLKKVGNVRGLCDESKGCVSGNVHIQCGPKNKPPHGERITTRDITIKGAGAAFPRSLKKREDDEGNTDAQVEFTITFVIPLPKDLNTEELLSQCEVRYGTNLFTKGVIIAAAGCLHSSRKL